MMMSKPAPTQRPQEQDAPKPTVDAPATKKNPEDAVKDLERRLAMLGGEGNLLTASVPTSQSIALNTTTAAAPATTAPAVKAPAAVKGGKNDLLARIMAAQERTKQTAAPTVTASAPTTAPPLTKSDDWSTLDLDDIMNPPPPAFDTVQLPPPPAEAAPPSFDAVADTLFAAPPQVQTQPPTMMWDPHAPTTVVFDDPPPIFAAPPTPSAPAYEDLLGFDTQSHTVTPIAPPPTQQSTSANAVIEEILGMQGLTDQEKQELIAEQQTIMAAIEKEKTQSAARAADAFEQRSHAAAVRAIGNPRARVAAEPTYIVSLSSEQQSTTTETDEELAVIAAAAGMTLEELKQMKADQELAEQLQKEEYNQAERDERRQERRQQRPTAVATAAAPKPKEQGWLEWLGLTSAAAAKPASPAREVAAPSTTSSPPAFAVQPSRPAQRGEIGVSRPPGSLTPARTGEEPSETITFSSSYDDHDMMPTARVAEQKPLFSCVADSITSSVTSLTTAMNTYNLPEDEEGNVHGVDSSSLLAMPNISRGSGGEGNYHNMSDRN